jgi:hypothetical protein
MYMAFEVNYANTSRKLLPKGSRFAVGGLQLDARCVGLGILRVIVVIGL